MTNMHAAIPEEKLTEAYRLLLEMRENCAKHADDQYDDPKREAKCEALNIAMTAMGRSITSRWIPVEERLPEGEGWVLVIGLLLKKKKGNYGWCVPHVAEYRHGRWCDADGMLPDLEERSLKVTHWMPLPESPEEVHE